MILIWSTRVECDRCGKSLPGKVYAESQVELDEAMRQEFSRWLLHYHKMYHHVVCWKCKKQLRADEVEDVLLMGKELKYLCKECANSVTAE